MNYTFSDKVSGLQASVIREILKATAGTDVIPFSAGNPAPEAFPVRQIQAITAEILEETPILALQYNITEGHMPLRDLLKKRMEAEKCFNPATDELICVSGAQQGNELACKVLCNEGDTLICEAPTFIGSLNAFRSYNVNLVGVELEADGISIEKLEEALKANPNTKLIYVIPNFQNPTGITMCLEKRKAVYALAQKYNVCILEDNPYGDLRFEGEFLPSIKSMDTDGRVIYTGSFSKILAPGLRVGYVSAPRDIVQKMVVCKQVSDVHTNILAQAICHRFMSTEDMDTHLAGLRDIYRKKYTLMRDEICKHFSPLIAFTQPQGGLFIWATMPEGCDVMAFCKRAASESRVAVVPGMAFMVRETDSCASFRMNFSTPTDEQIVLGCERLGALSKEMFGN